jgi:hypothetical protein
VNPETQATACPSPAAASEGDEEKRARRSWRPPVELAAPFAAALTVLLFFHRPLVSDAHFFFRDAARMSLPLRLFMAGEMANNRLPLWFPFESLGAPFLAQLTPGVLHPLNLVYWLAPFPKAFQLNYVGAFLLAALSTYRLSRVLGTRPLGALGSGLAYALSGALVTQSNLQYLVANATVPLALAATAPGLDRPTPLRLLLASSCFAVLFFAGDPQSVVVAALFGLALALAPKDGRERARALVSLVAVLTVSALFAGVQLLPSVEAFAPRLEAVTVDHGKWSFPALRILELGLANPYVETSETEIFRLLYGDSTHPWATSVYLGPCALSLAAIGARGDRRMTGILVAGLGCLYLALGPNYGLERAFTALVPLWSGFRFPEKMVVFAGLAAAVLLGRGIDRVTAGHGASAARGTALVFAVLGGVLFAARSATDLPHVQDHLSALARNAAISAALAGGLALVLHRPFREPAKRVVVPATLALAAVPLFAFNSTAVRFLPAEDLFVIPWAGQILRNAWKGPAPPRVYSTNPPDDMRHPSTGTSAHDAIIETRAALLPDFGAAFGIEHFRSYQPAAEPRHMRVEKLPEPLLYSRLLPVFGVDFAIIQDLTYTPPSRWELFREDPVSKVRIFRPREKLNRAFVARSAVGVRHSEEALAQLLSPGFRPGDTVAVECAVDPTDGEVADRGHATIVSYGSQRVEVAAVLTRPGFLVLNDSYAPGWRALVDGVEQPQCRVNSLVRGVKLSPGDHRVVYEYAPRSLAIGAGVSLASVAALLLLAARGRSRPSSPKPAAGRSLAEASPSGEPQR